MCKTYKMKMTTFTEGSTEKTEYTLSHPISQGSIRTTEPLWATERRGLAEGNTLGEAPKKPVGRFWVWYWPHVSGVGKWERKIVRSGEKQERLEIASLSPPRTLDAGTCRRSGSLHRGEPAQESHPDPGAEGTSRAGRAVGPLLLHSSLHASSPSALWPR